MSGLFLAYIKYESCGLNSRKFKEAIDMAWTHTAFQPQSMTSKNQTTISLPGTQVEILVLHQTIQIPDNLESPLVQAKGKDEGPSGNLGVSGKRRYFLEFHKGGRTIFQWPRHLTNNTNQDTHGLPPKWKHRAFLSHLQNVPFFSCETHLWFKVDF